MHDAALRTRADALARELAVGIRARVVHDAVTRRLFGAYVDVMAALAANAATDREPDPVRENALLRAMAAATGTLARLE